MQENFKLRNLKVRSLLYLYWKLPEWALKFWCAVYGKHII